MHVAFAQYQDIKTGVRYCGGPQVQYSSADMHIAALPSCFSSLLGTFRHFQALFGYAERFFCYAKHFPSILSVFFSSAKLFSAMLSPFLLCQAFFGYAEPFSALPSIFLLCRAVHSRAEIYMAEQKNNLA